MKKRTKIILSVLLILLSLEVGSRVYKHSITDVLVVNPNTEQEGYYYNGNEYMDLDDFAEDCVAKGFFNKLTFNYINPYEIVWEHKNLAKRYVTGYGNLSEKLWDPSFYIYIDKADKNNNILHDGYHPLEYYIRKDFVFPTLETNEVEAISFDSFYMDAIVADKQVIADFMEAIYEKGEATDKISEYLDKEYDTWVYFKYKGCDCLLELIGYFSIENGKFIMEKDIDYGEASNQNQTITFKEEWENAKNTVISLTNPISLGAFDYYFILTTDKKLVTLKGHKQFLLSTEGLPLSDKNIEVRDYAEKQLSDDEWNELIHIRDNLGEFEGLTKDSVDYWEVSYSDGGKTYGYNYGLSKNRQYDLIVEKVIAYSGIEVVNALDYPVVKYYEGNRG